MLAGDSNTLAHRRQSSRLHTQKTVIIISSYVAVTSDTSQTEFQETKYALDFAATKGIPFSQAAAPPVYYRVQDQALWLEVIYGRITSGFSGRQHATHARCAGIPQQASRGTVP